jgi:hypothetical protein
MLQKIASILIIAIVIFTTGYAQHTTRKKDGQIRKLKIEFVTGQMSLTQQQMQKFLPLYNRYSDELLVYRFAIKDLEENASASARQIEERQKLEEKMVEIKGKYKDEFLKIISAQQLANMYRAERDFKKVLLNYLENRDKHRK